MRPIVLLPVRRESPSCETFGDIDGVRRFEREVRLHRAHVEPFTVAPVDGRADGAFRVKGARGFEYVVDIVDRSGLRDTCTCPDFLANDLGVCKHVEATRRAIGARPALRRGYARLGDEPGEPVVTVDARIGPRLVAVGPWTPVLRAALACALRAVPAEKARAIVVGGRLPSGVRVVHAAVPALARLLDKGARARQQKSIEAGIAQGTVASAMSGWALFPYQRVGAEHLVRRGRALLADDMGLGKTIQAIAACEVLRSRGDARRILVVTTASLKHQWAKEIARWAGETAAIVGKKAGANGAAAPGEAAYSILNYELTWRELGRLRERSPDVLILDEAQRARNFRTRTAATLREIPSRFLFILTGTPIENRLDDIYSLMQLVDPAVLGPLWRFNVDFHEQNQNGKITGYKSFGELRARLRPYVLRRAKEEVLSDLPPLTEQTRYTAMDREQIELEEGYRGSASQLLAIAERRPLSKKEQERLMMYLLKARQACNALELCDPSRKRRASPKLDEFEALLTEITAQGTSKVLVFSEWVKMLELAGERLDRLGIGYRMLHGGVPTERRPELLDRFREDPSVRVLLSTDAGGVGLNLQAASYVIHLDLPWNPARLDQRTGRAHRFGQTRGVLVTHLCAEQGIERGIEGTLGQKRAVRAAALDPNATEDAVDAPSFSAFLRRTQEVLAALDTAGSGRGTEDQDEDEPEGAANVAEAAPLVAPATTAPGGERTPAAAVSGRAGERLRLARVVLGAGFPNDAARAAYEALATALRDLAGGAAPADHAGLVAFLYRELLPARRVPSTVHSVLARLHDLCSLQAAGVELPLAVAEEAIAEASALVGEIVG